MNQPGAAPGTSNAAPAAKGAATIFGDLASILTFVGSQAATFAVLVYITGFIYAQNFYDQLDVPIRGYDLPQNVIDAYAFYVFSHNGTAVVTFLYELLCFYVLVAMLARFKALPSDVYRVILIGVTSLAVTIGLVTCYRWANDLAYQKFTQVRLCNYATRVGFVLTRDAKRRYDRNFIDLSTRIDLRLAYEATDMIYAIRREPDVISGGWRYFTYGVPRSDTLVTIRREPPPSKSDPEGC
jgi:hypothetical protein